MKERDEANAKVKNLISERSRLQQTGDARVSIMEKKLLLLIQFNLFKFSALHPRKLCFLQYQDVVVLKKEVERWKEEAKVQVQVFF